MVVIDLLYEREEESEIAPQTLVESSLTTICSLLELDNVEISLLFVDNLKMRELNREYRGKDEPTDVLSFAQEESLLSNEKVRLLGDIVISLEALKENSRYFQVDFKEELQRVLIHGVLHLIGWDHSTNEEREPMLQKQEELLSIVLKGVN